MPLSLSVSTSLLFLPRKAWNYTVKIKDMKLDFGGQSRGIVIFGLEITLHLVKPCLLENLWSELQLKIKCYVAYHLKMFLIYRCVLKNFTIKDFRAIRNVELFPNSLA